MICPYIFMILFAAFCAWQDAADIKLHVTIKHRPAWIERCLLAGLFVIASTFVHGAPWWTALFDAVGCGAFFSAWFRLLLNLMRKRPWWYMGRRKDMRSKKDSWYDGRWHWLAWFIKGSMSYRYQTPAILANSAELLIVAAVIVIPLIIR
jgi:hypothetical protein